MNIYNADGSYSVDAVEDLNFVLRCRRTDAEKPIDIQLLTWLSLIYDHFGGKPLQIVSGYRNQRKQTSNHFKGRATDIRIEGVSPKQVRAFAETLDRGGMGIGLYPRSQFVHIDVRSPPSYRWIDNSPPNSNAAEKRPPRGWKRQQARELALAAPTTLWAVSKCDRLTLEVKFRHKPVEGGGAMRSAQALALCSVAVSFLLFVGCGDDWPSRSSGTGGAGGEGGDMGMAGMGGDGRTAGAGGEGGDMGMGGEGGSTGRAAAAARRGPAAAPARARPVAAGGSAGTGGSVGTGGRGRQRGRGSGGGAGAGTAARGIGRRRRYGAVARGTGGGAGTGTACARSTGGGAGRQRRARQASAGSGGSGPAARAPADRPGRCRSASRPPSAATVSFAARTCAGRARRTMRCLSAYGADHVCVNGACVAGNCHTAAECSSGKICVANTCVNCTDDGACASAYGAGHLCISGGCVAGECRTAANCPTGEICTRTFTCATCNTDGECVSGYGANHLCVSNLCIAGDCRVDRRLRRWTSLQHVDVHVRSLRRPTAPACAAFGAAHLCVNGSCIPGSAAMASECAAGEVCDANNYMCRMCGTDAECVAGLRRRPPVRERRLHSRAVPHVARMPERRALQHVEPHVRRVRARTPSASTGYGTNHLCVSGACVSGMCLSTADCGGGQICNTSTRSCVACSSDARVRHRLRPAAPVHRQRLRPGQCRVSSDCPGGADLRRADAHL